MQNETYQKEKRKKKKENIYLFIVEERILCLKYEHISIFILVCINVCIFFALKICMNLLLFFFYFIASFMSENQKQWFSKKFK